MTEKEKMKQGMLYDPGFDEDLAAERARCKDLCFDYNHLKPSQIEAQKAIIRELFGKTGQHFYITAPFWCDYGYNIEVGENFYTNHNCVILDGAKVTFGDSVFIAKLHLFHSRPSAGCTAAGHGTGIRLSHHRRRPCMVWRFRHGIARSNHRQQHSYRCRQRGEPGHSLRCDCRWKSLPGIAAHHGRR